jgi:hypothetical protein
MLQASFSRLATAAMSAELKISLQWMMMNEMKFFNEHFSL